MTTKLITIPATPNATLAVIQKLDKFIRWHSPTVKFYLAGGAIRKAFRGETIGSSDIDLFFPSHNDLMKASNILDRVHEGSMHPNCKQYHFDYKDESPFTAKEIEGASPTNGSGERLISIPIQLIHSSYFDTQEELIDNFDFTVCQMLYQKGNYFFSEKALSDDANGILDFASTEYDQNRFKHNRLLKYCKYGYTPTLEVFRTVFLEPDALYIGDFSVNDANAEYEI
jgi:hypothetical protein